MSEEHTYVQSIITRHTRSGTTDWPKAAEALGMDLNELRDAYDLDIPEIPPYAERFTVPGIYPIKNHPEGAPLKKRILEILATMSAAITTISGHTGHRTESVRLRMNQLSKSGLVRHDGRIPRTWALTDTGRQMASLLSERRAA